MNEKRENEDKSEGRKKVEKDAIEDIKPIKGSPDVFEEGEPSKKDVIQKFGGDKSDKEDKEKKDKDTDTLR